LENTLFHARYGRNDERSYFTMHSELISIAQEIAAHHGLDPALICAIIAQESAWNPHAIRYEPAFFTKYVAPLFTNNKVAPPTNTEAHSRAISWGLMQVMGQSAREMGFAGQYLSELCDPAVGIEVGCTLFAYKLRIAAGNISQALRFWNGGANPNYSAEVESRMASYLSEPS
jgi:soluble lytic murein transglycosylase-like protein